MFLLHDIKQTPSEQRLDSCIDEEGKTINIEISHYDPPLAMPAIIIATLLVTTYADSGITHGMAMYTRKLTDKQCDEIIGKIKQEPSKYRNQ